MVTTPDERKFVVFQRGEVRDDIILLYFRNALRSLINPETKIGFTEDEIFLATQPGSRFYIEADAIDLYGQAMQSRGLFFVSQTRPTTSSTSFLEGQHGPLWLGDDSRLGAVGASGTVDAPATAGSIFVGSTTIPSATAAIATDPNGLRYQVLQTVATPASGTAALTMKGIDTGTVTNVDSGTILTWSANFPLGADPEASTSAVFDGGFDKETDQEWSERIEDRMRNRPASGNNAHFEAWARQASVAVESAFVYATGLNAGSVVVAILEKRGLAETGPISRQDVSVGTLTDVTTFLTPPASPVVPEHVFVIVVKANSQPSDLAIRVAMNKGTSGGWADSTPWPGYTVLFPEAKVTSVTSTTLFDVTTDDDLPGGASLLTGVDAPSLMVWNDVTSRFIELDVNQISKTGNVATVTLNTAPSVAIAVDDRISPYTDQNLLIAETVADYFDELGPGEVVDLDTDHRAVRAFRFPTPSVKYPSRAGQVVVTRLIDALGGISTDATLERISRNSPDLPTDITDGPNIVTLGELNIFSL